MQIFSEITAEPVAAASLGQAAGGLSGCQSYRVEGDTAISLCG